LGLHLSEGDSEANFGAGYPGNAEAGLFVDDLTAFHEKMVKHNVHVVQAPAKQQWGGSQAIYKSPGHHIISAVEAKGYVGDQHGSDAKAADDPTTARLAYAILRGDPKTLSPWLASQFGWSADSTDLDMWHELNTKLSKTRVAVQQLHDTHQAAKSVDWSLPAAGFACIGLHVDDLDSFHKRMVEHKVQVQEEPVSQPWGWRTARYSSPQGHQLSFIEHPGFPADQPADKKRAHAAPDAAEDGKEDRSPKKARTAASNE